MRASTTHVAGARRWIARCSGDKKTLPALISPPVTTTGIFGVVVANETCSATVATMSAN